MKKILLLILTLSFISTGIVNAECPLPDCTGEIEFQTQCCEALDVLREHRHAMYNALNLTPDQMKWITEIEKNVEFDLDSLFLQICIETGKLKQMQADKCSRSVINAQKQKIKVIEKEIDKIIEQCDKKFETVLSCDQTAKYHMMRKLERSDIKHYDKPHKQNPDLRVFGEKPTPRPIKPCRKPSIFRHK